MIIPRPPVIKGGLQQPMISHRFNITYKTSKFIEGSSELIGQTIQFIFDLKGLNFSVTLETPIDNKEFITDLLYIMNNDSDIQLNFLNQHDEIKQSIAFSKCKCISHQSSLSYSSSDAVTQTLNFSFDTFNWS